MKLIWPIRHSFVRYVRTVGGEIHLSDGAREGSDGFVFPQAVDCSPVGSGTGTRFAGAIRFVAHGGLLDVTVANPSVRLIDGSGAIDIDQGDGVRFEFGRLNEGEGSDVATATIRMTVTGARLLGDVYSPGDFLDPMRVDGQPDA
ncbi:HtaA domain-containing protein [Leucobacter allii]|uniref:HtaA domain-containing protein n=1 Tax=Leucobacter allii TaxID=2932247 RepID=A0ABY4FMM0_9MICO|nr:HtaA domain-containing protein [Leucobacter allii]UOQ57527.1 HtaA domain-containing protein [Leucobacter allii]